MPRARKTRIEKETEIDNIKREDVAQRAYDLYLRRGEAHGHDVEDWLAAERELSTEVPGSGISAA